jgi:hypothetical protein
MVLKKNNTYLVIPIARDTEDKALRVWIDIKALYFGDSK